MKAEQVPEGPLLVDTDVFSLLYRRKGRYKDFEGLVTGHPLAMSFASRAEALAPVFRAKGIAPGTEQRLRDRLRMFVTIPYDEDVVDWWAKAWARLKDQLKGGGRNDLWTAACALSRDLPLVTNDLSDFRKVQSEFPALQLVNPDL